MGAGHYGIFSGKRWREKVYPEVKAFIETFGSGQAAGSGTVRKLIRRAG
jgi:poly(3-hydroxybutyrate) depolymerase